MNTIRDTMPPTQYIAQKIQHPIYSIQDVISKTQDVYMVTTEDNTTYIINQLRQEIVIPQTTATTTTTTTTATESNDDITDDNNSPSVNSIPTTYTAKMFYNLKQKRKRKLRNEPDEQSEYLEKMSVRGLDIQKYEHIVDGVAYCAVCAKKEIFKTFKNKYSFQRHAYLFHEGDNRKIFACPVCSKEFSRPDKMKMHKKDKHSDVVDMEEQMKAAAAEEDKPAVVAKTPVRRKRTTKAQKLLQMQLQQQQQQEEEQQQQLQNDNNQTIIIETKSESNNSNQSQSNCTSHQLQTIDLSNMILPSQLQISTADLIQHHQQQQQQQQQQQLQNTTILYNQIDLNNALLQNQLHANNIIIQGPIGTTNGSLLPVQTLDGSIFHHQPQHLNQQQSSHQHIQIKNAQVMTSVPMSTTSTTTLSSTSTSNSSHHQQHHQHHQHDNNQQQNLHHHHHLQQHQMDMTSLTKLENVSYLPNSNENHVIGTVQSYQIITPDGLHAYQPKILNANEIELCPFTSSAGGSYTFSSTSSNQSNNNNNTNNTDHSQFMDIKKELIINGDQFMDTSGMYHLPFSPSSMINAVSEVNNSSLLETKEISYDITEAVLLAL